MVVVKSCTGNKGFILHLMGGEEVRVLLKCPFLYVNTCYLFGPAQKFGA